MEKGSLGAYKAVRKGVRGGWEGLGRHLPPPPHTLPSITYSFNSYLLST